MSNFTIKGCFSKIAQGYDLANTISSLGMHHLWNQKLVDTIGPCSHLLDLCAGTGEIALRYLRTYKDSKALLIDFCPEMLGIAKQKSAQFEILVADVEKIPLEGGFFDAATMAYGIRNVKNRAACFAEVHRLLKPGANFGILELTRPELLPLRAFHKLYTKAALPLIGKLFSHDAESYRYLARSIQEFVPKEQLCLELEAAGFKPIRIHSLAAGVATIIISSRL